MSPWSWFLLSALCLLRPGAAPPRRAPASANCELEPQVSFALNQTLLQQESLRAGSLQIPYSTEALIKHCNCGDLSSVIFSHGSCQVTAPRSADLHGEGEPEFRKKRRQRRQRLRQFSDLWVRLEESAVGPQLQVPVLDGPISAELLRSRHGQSPHSQAVASTACLALWTPVFWVLVLAFQTEALFLY